MLFFLTGPPSECSDCCFVCVWLELIGFYGRLRLKQIIVDKSSEIMSQLVNVCTMLSRILVTKSANEPFQNLILILTWEIFRPLPT
jgi:hypothetical protein